MVVGPTASRRLHLPHQRIYNSEYETAVSADARSYGLGAVLLQKQPAGEFKLVAYTSRSMTDTERRYAQIEKEALALTWALEHWRDYLIGLLMIKVDRPQTTCPTVHYKAN